MDALGSLLAQQQPGGLSLFIDKVARTPLSKIFWFALALTVLRVGLHFYIQRTPDHLRTGAFSFAKFVNEFADAIVYAAIVVFMLVRPFAVQTFVIPTGSMIDTLRVNDYIVANKWVYRTSDPEFQDIVVFKPPPDGLLPGQENTQMDYIKRCIGVPGQTVEIRDKQLYIDGEAVEEPYVAFTMQTNPNKVAPKDNWASIQIPNFKLVEHDGEVWPVSWVEDPGTGRRFANVDPRFTAKRFQVYSEGTGGLQIDDDLMQELLDAPAAAVPADKFLMIGDNRNGSYDSRAWGPVDRDAIIGRSEFIWLPFNRIGKTR